MAFDKGERVFFPEFNCYIIPCRCNAAVNEIAAIIYKVLKKFGDIRTDATDKYYKYGRRNDLIEWLDEIETFRTKILEQRKHYNDINDKLSGTFKFSLEYESLSEHVEKLYFDIIASIDLMKKANEQKFIKYMSVFVFATRNYFQFLSHQKLKVIYI